MSRNLVIRAGRSGLSLRLPYRATVITGLLALLLFVAFCLAAAFGVYPIPVIAAVRALVGSGNHLNVFVIQQLRIPRILEGLLVGAGLGLSGAIFQSLTRNPLASPDILAQQWLFGDLTESNWYSIRYIAIAFAILTPAALLLGRQLNTFQLGEDLAASLGIRTNLLQLSLAGIGAFLAAVVVSFCGPIGFVAFISPHIARRLAHTPSAASMPAAMAVGGLLVLLADYIAERIVQPVELPVGITTILIGAPYLLFLLYKTERDSGVA